MKNLARLALVVGVCSVVGGAAGDAEAKPAPKAKYHFVDITSLVPEGALLTDPVGIADNGRVVETSWSCDDVACTPSINSVRKGKSSVVANNALAYSLDNRGTVGGSVVTDSVNFIEQAALFDDYGHTHLIPRITGEYTSHVKQVTDSGLALVESLDESFVASWYIYDRRHRVVSLPIGDSLSINGIKINDDGIVSATQIPSTPADDRAFRYDPYANEKHALQVFAPLPGDEDTWGLSINDNGDILGYSFVPFGVEHIGVFKNKSFKTVYTEGTDDNPTRSNTLLWNEDGLIVLTDTNDLNSYVVPKKNTRLNLADITDAPLDPWTKIIGINEDGDLVGEGGSDVGLVERLFVLELKSKL